jgi:hypothetical protein
MSTLFWIGFWAIGLGYWSSMWQPMIPPADPPHISHPAEPIGNRRARRRAAKMERAHRGTQL